MGVRRLWERGSHGAVTIEQVRIDQTPDAAESFDHMLDLLISGLVHRS